MVKSEQLLTLAVIGGGIYYLATREPGSGGGGNGGGGAGGTVTASVAVGGVTVENAAELGQPIPKVPGQTLGMRLVYIPEAVDPQGNPVDWPFWTRWIVGHNTQLGFDQIPGSPRDTQTTLPASEMGKLREQITGFASPNDVGVTYDARAEIHAARSDNAGNPVPGSGPGGFAYDKLADKDSHPGIMEAVGAWIIQAGATQTSVAVGGVTVSQRSAGRYLYRPLYR